MTRLWADIRFRRGETLAPRSRASGRRAWATQSITNYGIRPRPAITWKDAHVQRAEPRAIVAGRGRLCVGLLGRSRGGFSGVAVLRFELLELIFVRSREHLTE